jgi:hypothetical protein
LNLETFTEEQLIEEQLQFQARCCLNVIYYINLQAPYPEPKLGEALEKIKEYSNLDTPIAKPAKRNR